MFSFSLCGGSATFFFRAGRSTSAGLIAGEVFVLLPVEVFPLEPMFPEELLLSGGTVQSQCWLSLSEISSPSRCGRNCHRKLRTLAIRRKIVRASYQPELFPDDTSTVCNCHPSTCLNADAIILLFSVLCCIRIERPSPRWSVRVRFSRVIPAFIYSKCLSACFRREGNRIRMGSIRTAGVCKVSSPVVLRLVKICFESYLLRAPDHVFAASRRL